MASAESRNRASPHRHAATAAASSNSSAEEASPASAITVSIHSAARPDGEFSKWYNAFTSATGTRRGSAPTKEDSAGSNRVNASAAVASRPRPASDNDRSTSASVTATGSPPAASTTGWTASRRWARNPCGSRLLDRARASRNWVL